MKKIYLLLIALFMWFISKSQVCDTTANVIIYSNYDGGALNIDVDKNIPNLKIGVTSYEAVNITISGTYSANVTEVLYAGYNATDNHCGIGAGITTINSAPATLDSIVLYPPAVYNNSNGYSSIICNYSCDITSNQGGCNTPINWFIILQRRLTEHFAIIILSMLVGLLLLTQFLPAVIVASCLSQQESLLLPRLKS